MQNVAADDYMIISVGGLSKRMNYAMVILAIKKPNNPHLKYVVAGIGKEKIALIGWFALELEKYFSLLY